MSGWRIVAALLQVTRGSMHPAELWMLREDIALAMLEAEAANRPPAQGAAHAAEPGQCETPSPVSGTRSESGSTRITSMAQLKGFLKGAGAVRPAATVKGGK